MKKIKIYLPLLVIIVTTVGLTFDVIIPNVYSLTPPTYNEQVSFQKDNLWSLGKNLSVGDSYTYKICDHSAIVNYSAENYHYFTKDKQHNSSLCYIIKLDFVNLLNSDENQINSDIWVVQASISDILGIDHSIRRSVFHIDSQNFEVRSADTIHPDTIRYTQSLQNTIFSIVKYTASEPKFLQQGIKWGEVTEYLDKMQINPYMEVLQENLEFSTIQNVIDYSQNKLISLDKTFDVYKVGYEIDIIDNDLTQEDTNNVINSYLISSQFPFPVSGTLYSPAHVVEPFKEYEFELISFVSSNVMGNNDTIENNDISINDDVIIDGSVDENIIDPIIEEDIVTDDIVEENVVDKVIDDDPISIDDTTDGIILEDADENIVVEEVIEKDKIVVENMVESETSDDNKDNNSSVINFVSLVLLLVVTVGGFVYYKKFKNNNLKSCVSNNSKSESITKTIHFDDKVTINIKKKQQ